MNIMKNIVFVVSGFNFKTGNACFFLRPRLAMNTVYSIYDYLAIILSRIKSREIISFVDSFLFLNSTPPFSKLLLLTTRRIGLPIKSASANLAPAVTSLLSSNKTSMF